MSTADTSTIEIRNLKFDLSGVPRFWHPRGAGASMFWDELSVFFPVGETFFVKSVRHYLPQITDPKLKADVTAFAGQEGFHGREHIAYNDRLAQWYPIAKMERLLPTFLLWIAAKFFSPRRQLAVTAALEHFTSLMGEHILSTPSLLEGVHPQMAGLWRWHAAEESEHRAVAFDVYKAVGGTWFERCRVMVVVTVMFWAAAGLNTMVFMAKSGKLFSVPEWWRLFRTLLVDDDALLRALWRPYVEYYRRDFHPMNRGDEQLLAEWKQSQIQAA
jgi:predicted metal-dependent hydrolase